MNNYSPRRNAQRGMVLILIAFIIGLGAAAFMFKMFNASNLQAAQDEKTMRVLNEAKAALIAWSVSHSYTPGQMPWPDRNGDGNYDGSSDCVATVFQYSYLLGQLPSLPTTSPCLDPNNGLTVYSGLSTYPGLGREFRDAQGNKLWYAVSRNLVRDYVSAENPVINPGMINPNPVTGNYAPAPYLRQGGTTSYPWLKVLDRNGSVVSDRVAVVIIAPGDSIGGQDRSGVPDASQYLDSFQIGAAIFSNRGYATADEDFIMSEDSRNVSSSDASFNQPYYFNDKLVYITIDELMDSLEKRVGEVTRSSLKKYQDINGYYPYAAHLGTSLSYVSDANLLSGFLPIFQACNYNAVSATNRSLSCTQPIFDAFISGITTVRFYLPSGTFTSSTGSCTRQNGNTRCYCTGAGSCSRASLTFSCNAMTCSAVGTGATGDVRIRDGNLTFATGGCVINTSIARDTLGCPISNTNTSRANCSATNGSVASYSNGDAALDSFLPVWFKDNRWQEYVFYRLTRPSSAIITVGNKVTEAVLIVAGKPINVAPFTQSKGFAQKQVRPSCDTLSDYLDSAENADGNTIYDATSKLRTSNYNDQTFVVAP